MIAVVLLAVSFHTDFEGGSLGRIERLSDTHFRLAVQGEADQDGRNRQANWYYFRIDGAAGREITIDLVDLVGEYNYRRGSHSVTQDTYPVYSYDRRHWRHFDAVAWDDKTVSLRLRFTPEQKRMWIAHVPPYTNQDLARLLKAFEGHPHLRREVIGKTVRNREMLLLTVTNPAAPEKRKKVVWLMFRQHAWETGSSWVGEGALRFLLSDDPSAVRIRDEVVFKIFPMADPDGVARGGVRFNANGYDLNRNWDDADAARMPEIAAQRRAVLDWVDSGRRLDVFLTLHNTETAEYLDGLPSEAGAASRELVDRLFRLLVETTTFNPTRPPRDPGLSTTPGKPGRMTVAQGLFHDRGIAALTMEQMIAHNPKLGRKPAVEDRLKFGEGLVRALWAAVAVPGASGVE